MIDLHCHLDLFPSPLAVVEEVIRRRTYVLSVTTLPSAFIGTAKLAGKSERIRTALGFHPELVAGRLREIELFAKHIHEVTYVGEIGLDGSRPHRDSLGIQKEVLQNILQLCSSNGGRVLSLHSRGAIDDVLDALSANISSGQFILHWFVGSELQISRAVEMGCWFSVNPSMFDSVTGRSAIAAMPPERILPESDGPFAQLKNCTLYPWDAWQITLSLAEMWKLSKQEVEHAVMSNFRNLVSGKMALLNPLTR